MGYHHDQQFADDITLVSISMKVLALVNAEVTITLMKGNLMIKQDKKEEVNVKHGDSEDNWRKVKYLESILDTEKYFQRRKILEINEFNTFNAKLLPENHLFSLKFFKFWNALAPSIFVVRESYKPFCEP